MIFRSISSLAYHLILILLKSRVKHCLVPNFDFSDSVFTFVSQSILASAKAAVKAKVGIDVVLTVKEDDPLPDTWYVCMKNCNFLAPEGTTRLENIFMRIIIFNHFD